MIHVLVYLPEAIITPIGPSSDSKICKVWLEDGTEDKAYLDWDDMKWYKDIHREGFIWDAVTVKNVEYWEEL